MESTKVRVRPLRFAFLVDPRDKAGLQKIFEANSCLWGGIYNFILPLFKRVPLRYRQEYQKQISGEALMNGLVEAFQPDILIETRAGQAAAYGIEFPEKRTGSMEELEARDEQARTKLGIDLRSVCDDLYRSTFRFVQRHPPKVVLPVCGDKRFNLLFAATFGYLPESGNVADVADVYLKALDGKKESIKPVEFPRLFDPRYFYPLRATAYRLKTTQNSWSFGPKLFYMDETSPLDLIDFWNLRALGWDILPLPVSLASQLIRYCETLIAEAHRPLPPPSNAFYDAGFLCAKSQPVEELRAFVNQLKKPASGFVTIDHSFPRIWEEWGRSADQAEPQTIEHDTRSVEAHVLGSGLHISSELHDFSAEDSFSSRSIACANVLESLSDGTPVIPWKKNVAASLTHNFGEETTWVSREGIVIFAGEYARSYHLRVPNALNIFTAVAETVGLSLDLSSAGKTCEQIISAVGGLRGLGIVVRSPDLLKLLDSLAHEDFEVEDENEEHIKKRLFKSYAPLSKVCEVLRRANPEPDGAWQGNLTALLYRNVLKIGMALSCPECEHSSWFSIESLAPKLQCPRCLSEFRFPAALPPERDAWAYRVIGPFAVGNFAQGSYCVGAALHFLKDKIARESTWLSSFEMKDEDGKTFEADFGMFAVPSRLSHATSPYMIIGECKSFNRFGKKDFARARESARLFPGAVLCFCTFNESLNREEIRGIRPIAAEGRAKLEVGKQTNPVLILTARELFGQWSIIDFYSLYGDKAQYAQRLFMRDDLQEICDFTQQLYLGMPSLSEWQEAKRRKKITRLAARKSATQDTH
jgi:hypothetical protein